jgi:hypothetical protein
VLAAGELDGEAAICWPFAPCSSSLADSSGEAGESGQTSAYSYVVNALTMGSPPQ